VDTELSPITIADDGELADVRQLLRKLDLPFDDTSRGHSSPPSLQISNPRHALEQCARAGDDVPEGHSFHIVILDEDSASLRRELKSGHFDFIVQRPVHPAALRLLILHALYSGPEKRSAARVAMSADIKLGSGLLPRAATLTQLSEKGCGLISDRQLDVGDRTTVVFPRGLTASRSLSLNGRVVASTPAGDDPCEGHEISIAFRPPSGSVRELLRSLMASHSVGSASLHLKRGKPSTQTAQSPATSGSEPNTARSGGERRRAPRKSYSRPVLASAKGAVHTLIGRDLSTGGMRVAADDRLSEGDEFKLVIYGRAGCAPLLVKAVVARNEGPDGCALLFRNVGSSVGASLEEMVNSLPQLAHTERGPNVVLSEIIEGG
jgi:hypothetical protein